jgi:DNA-binding IclR family transcriptional regulator
MSESDVKRPAPEARRGKEMGTVDRVLMALSDLVDHPGTSATQAALRLGLPPSTTHRLMRMMVAQEVAWQDRHGAFFPGRALYRLAGKLRGDVPYVALAKPLLRLLTERFEETAMLTLFDRRRLRVYFADVSFPQDPMRYEIELNRLESLVWGASGRAVLAHLTAAEQAQAMAEAERSAVTGAALDPGELRGDLDRIRAQGYAVSHSHRTRDAVGLAAPFFQGDGQIAGCISMRIPEFRFDAAALPILAEAMCDAAETMSRQIGFSR